MSNLKTLEAVDVSGKRVLVRVDFNVPVQDGRVTDTTRIKAVLPTIEHLRRAGARVILASHFGRPAGTGYEQQFSLRPVAAALADLIGAPVVFAEDIAGPDARQKAAALSDGQVLLLENLRFDAREKENDPALCEELASLADVYVNDAFGAAHRAHASTTGVAKLLPAYAGFLMDHEIATLSNLLDDPKRPFVAILGGSKVSDKIKIINALIERCDTLIIGGGMCFTFLAAQGYEVGSSLVEGDWIDRSAEMIEKARTCGTELLLPVDVVCADRFAADATIKICSVDAIPQDMMGLDIGPQSSERSVQAIAGAQTVFWNGPMGVFEVEPFAAGTKAVAEATAANERANTIIGGGDSAAAVNLFGLADRMTFISTGGGASMKLVEGGTLPGVEALRA